MNQTKMIPMARRAVSKLSAHALYEYALRALGRRSHTLAELEAKLTRRSSSEREVSGVLSRLRDQGYLDDERVAEAHSVLRRDHALVGQKRVLAELRRRGVEESLAERAVADAYEELDESELARQFLRRKFGHLAQAFPTGDRKIVIRLYRALVRAGFEHSAVFDALRDVSSNDELLDQLAEATAGGYP